MNNEKEFDEAIESMEAPQSVDLNESDFGLTEERDSQQPQFAREYSGMSVDSYGTPWNIPSAGPIQDNNYNPLMAPMNYEQRFTPWDNPYVRAAAGRDYYERSMYHRDGENPVYYVRPEVINIDRDYDIYNLFNSPAPFPQFHRSATVKFVVRCPSCNGTNEIVVLQDVLLRNPDPHVGCVCGAELIIEGMW